jgi:hypothetical protein
MPVAALGFTQTKFASETDARAHCPTDAVVWLTLPNNVFVQKSDPHYGAPRGSYICEHDAVAAGYHAAR